MGFLVFLMEVSGEGSIYVVVEKVLTNKE